MRGFLKGALTVLLLAALGFAARSWGFGLIRISGTSMSGTLMDGDVALVTRFDYLGGRTPDFGDVVECRFPGRRDIYVKRVAGLPGDEIRISAGVLSRNGRRVTETYVSSFAADFQASLEDNQYLLLGDNRAESYDSRMPDMGPVGADAFLGRVRFVVWPPDRIGRVI